MRVLQVAPQVPYPPSDGGKVGIYNITRHLAARGHEVTLFALDRSPGVDYSPLRAFCDLRTFPHSADNSVGGAFLNLFSDLPYIVSKYRSEELAKSLASFAGSEGADVVHVDHLQMAAYGAALGTRFGLPIVLREHNIESVIVERFAAHARNPAVKLYARLQHARMRRYEAEMAGRVDAVCPITTDDAARLLAMNPSARVKVVPGGVDSSYFAPAGGPSSSPGSIVFFGTMDWLPNLDAMEWFFGEVFPLVLAARPDAVLTIVGKAVPPSIARLAGPNVVIRGFVEDLCAEVRRHTVSIAPFRIGGGMRLKIIESFAMGVPVVSTTVGCEGIGAQPGREIVVADTAADFARETASLLGDAARRGKIAVAARELASKRYRWEEAAAGFEEVYRMAIARKRNG